MDWKNHPINTHSSIPFSLFSYPLPRNFHWFVWQSCSAYHRPLRNSDPSIDWKAYPMHSRRISSFCLLDSLDLALVQHYYYLIHRLCWLGQLQLCWGWQGLHPIRHELYHPCGVSVHRPLFCVCDDLQLLMAIVSSINPSYVSCVQRGVTISTLRSMMISWSMWLEMLLSKEGVRDAV